MGMVVNQDPIIYIIFSLISTLKSIFKEQNKFYYKQTPSLPPVWVTQTLEIVLKHFKA